MFQRIFIPPDLKTLLKLEELFEVHFNQPKLSTFYYNELKISLRQLNRYIKFCRDGKILKDLIRKRRYKAALKLVNETCVSMKKISYEIGIQDPSYFSRSFKAMNGRSPSSHKKGLVKPALNTKIIDQDSSCELRYKLHHLHL